MPLFTNEIRIGKLIHGFRIHTSNNSRMSSESLDFTRECGILISTTIMMMSTSAIDSSDDMNDIYHDVYDRWHLRWRRWPLTWTRVGLARQTGPGNSLTGSHYRAKKHQLISGYFGSRLQQSLWAPTVCTENSKVWLIAKDIQVNRFEKIFSCKIDFVINLNNLAKFGFEKIFRDGGAHTQHNL